MSDRQSGNEPGHSAPPSSVVGVRLQFGNFTLDRQKHALFRSAQRVHLTPKPLKVLEILVCRCGEVVPKQELLASVWLEEFVTDDVLVQAIGESRRALEDDKDNPAFVQTVPREGYRFIAPVTVERPEVAVRSDLRVIAGIPARQTTASPQHQLPGLRFGVIIVIALMAGTCAVYYWRYHPSRPEWSQPRLISQIGGSPQSPAFSPDGGRIAYVNTVDGIDQIFVRDLGQAASIQLTSGTVPAAVPRWSPKNDQILFSRGVDPSIPMHGRQSVWSVHPLGGPLRLITDDARNPAWSADGSRIVFERGSDIWICAADGGNQRRLEGVPASQNLLAYRTPSFSPDGSSIAFFHPETGPKGDFWIMPAAGGKARRLTFDVCQGSKPVWTADGKWILFASERSGASALWRVPVDGGKPQLVLSATGDDGDPDLSLDGRRLIYVNSRHNFVLTLLDPATGAFRQLAQHRSNMTYPMFDPQGRRVVFFMQDRERRTDSIYTIGLDGGDLRPVTGQESDSTFPHWSGDGTHIYYYALSPSHSFRRIATDGGPSSEVVAGWTWEVNYGARVDSQERFIVYSEEHAAAPVRTLIRDIATGMERALPKALDDPRWSRDEQSILGVVYTAAKPPEGQITECPLDGGLCREVAIGYMPIGSADNRSIYFLRKGEVQDGAELWIIAKSGGPARKLAELRPLLPIAHMYDVSPRGEIVFVQFKPGNRELWMAERR